MQDCRWYWCVVTMLAVFHAVKASVLQGGALSGGELNETAIRHGQSWISVVTYEAGDEGKVYINDREVHSMRGRGGIGRVRLPLQSGDVVWIEGWYKEGEVKGMAVDVMVGRRHFGTGGKGWKGVRAGGKEWREGCEWGRVTVVGGRAMGFPVRGGAKYVWVRGGGRRVWVRYVVGGEECEVVGMVADEQDRCFCKERENRGGVCWEVAGGGEKGECERRECERGYDCVGNEIGDGLLCLQKRVKVRVVKKEDGSCERMHGVDEVTYMPYERVE